ncbi:MAG: Hsp20 family protein [Terrimonas sp.]|nr:Hsp20 family protein [Terrimonas sp.]
MTQVKFNSRPFDKTVDGIFDEIINGLPVFFNEGLDKLGTRNFVPVNIQESNDAYRVEIIAPGFEKSDFKVSLEGNLLTITGEKNTANKQENLKTIRKEFSFRNFKRSFTIDEKIEATHIEASYVNGVLVLNLPKKAEVKATSKEIVIN